MQLDLFSDNHRTIRLNDADNLLRVLQLEQALAVYTKLLDDAPDDAEFLGLQSLVASWRERLSRFHAAPAGAEVLNDLWLDLMPETPPPLAAALRELLIERLSKLPSPELIYTPPRFHLGTILLAAGKFAEAEHWFARALHGGIGERARFMAWRGDALTLLGDTAQARDAYCAAFLEGPYEVDMEALRSPMVQDLLFSLECDGDEAGETDLPAWLPVWGWLHGVFGLHLNEVTAAPINFGAVLKEADKTGSLTPPRLWFDCLCYAEYLRTISRDDREMIRVRRQMKHLNGFMFDRYMEKIRNGEGEWNQRGQA